MGERRGDTVKKRLGTDEAVIGQHVGAVGKMLARAETDFEVQRPLVAEQSDGSDLPFTGYFERRQKPFDEFLLPLTKLVPARPAVKAVERQRIAGFERRHEGGALIPS